MDGISKLTDTPFFDVVTVGAEEEKIQPVDYLDISTNQLLEKFGGGSHIPGSGSAAALSAMLGVELMITVCKLTRSKDKYISVHEDFKFIQSALEDQYRKQLRTLFVVDITSFDEVSKIRTARQATEDVKEKNRLTRQLGPKLRESTLIPIELCRLSLRLLDYSFSVFDKGFKTAQGDSGVAISNLLSATSGALFVAFINLKYGKSFKWAPELRIETERLAIEYNSKHKQALQRVLNLYTAGLPEGNAQAKITFD